MNADRIYQTHRMDNSSEFDPIAFDVIVTPFGDVRDQIRRFEPITLDGKPHWPA